MPTLDLRTDMSRTSKPSARQSAALIVVCSLALAGCGGGGGADSAPVAGAAEHLVRPGQPPQPILDAAAAGDTIVLLPGLHQHGLGRHRAILSVEKPISIEIHEADELIAIARRNGVKFTIGYSQRFNPKYAYVHKCATDGTLGRPVSALVSRHIGRSLGKKITGRSKLSPAAMESTHDLDFLLWCLAPAKPIRVYSQNNYGAMRDMSGADVPDTQYIMVTMDSGVSLMVGGGWSLPPAYPNFSSTWIELIGTEGALIIDDTHRDTQLSTVKNGIVHPMSTMPGEYVEHTYAGAMAPETDHFIEACALDKPVLVTAEQARQVMEVYVAADISAERHEPVSLPLPESRH
jgi:scyllo-inositol 2-dehydrogenase (NAD+)